VPSRAEPARLSASARAEIAQRTLDGLDVPSGAEALRRYGDARAGGPGWSVGTAVDDATGLPYRLDIFATRIGGEVVLSVGVWPLPEIVRPARRFRFVSDLIEGSRNAPVVRSKSLGSD
jgi:hypothetical protein